MGRVRKAINDAIGNLIAPVVELEIRKRLRNVEITEYKEQIILSITANLRSEVDALEERVNNLIGMRNDILDEVREIVLFSRTATETDLKNYIQIFKVGGKSTMYQSRIKLDDIKSKV